MATPGSSCSRPAGTAATRRAGKIISTHVTSSDRALYIQDVWTIDQGVTLTAGLRVDGIKRRDRLFDVVTQRSVEVGPRIGVSYLLPKQRDAVRASWTRVHSNLSENEPQAGANVAGFRDFYDLDFDGAFETVFVTPPRRALSSNLAIDLNDYHQGHADELSLGYRRQFGRSSFDANVTRRAYRNRPAVVESNAIYDGVQFLGYRDVSQNEIYRLTANHWNWPTATALQLAWATRASRLALTASYTREWSSLHGTWQPNDPASFLQPDAFRNADGIGLVHGCTNASFCADANSLSPVVSGGTWRTHIANAAASYAPPWGLQLALAVNIQSGPWSGPILSTTATRDPRFGPDIITLSNGRVVSNPLATPIRLAYATRQEGQFTLPTLQIWNARIGWSIRRRGQDYGVTLDVLNAWNGAADQAFQPGANLQFSPSFGLGTTRQFPRALQLSAQVRF